MIAVIVRRKNRVRRIFALQHPRRMRHANEKHRLRIAFPRGIVYRLAGMLFEEVVDVLNDSRVAPADSPYSFGEPAYRWTKRDAILPDLSLRAQVLQCLPKTILVHLFHPDIVQL